MLQMGRDVVEAVTSQVASKPRTLDAFEALSDRCVDGLRIELERAGWREEEER
jgi:hypothetical protein